MTDWVHVLAASLQLQQFTKLVDSNILPLSHMKRTFFFLFFNPFLKSISNCFANISPSLLLAAPSSPISVTHLSGGGGSLSVTMCLLLPSRRGLMRLPSLWLTDYINSSARCWELSGSRAPPCRQRLCSHWCPGGLWGRNEAGGWHRSHTPTPLM